MARQKNGGKPSQRAIDQTVLKARKSLKSKFVLIPSMEIKAWKAFIVIMFVAGFSAAFVWSAYNGWYIGSDAKVNTSVQKRVPEIVSSSPSGTLVAGTNSTVLSVKTERKAQCKYGQDTGSKKKPKYLKFAKTGKNDHYTSLVGLANGQTYTYNVICKDNQSNLSNATYKVIFSISQPAQGTDTSCIKAGAVSKNGSLGSNGNFGKCCSGLKEIDNGMRYDPTSQESSDKGCVSVEGAGVICSDCGNGSCEQWENACNCPKDCPASGKTCIKAGKSPRNASLGPNGNFGTCCTGLAEIAGGTEYDANAGMCAYKEGTGSICSPCGDGTCDQWENYCNCPKDCPAQKSLSCIQEGGLTGDGSLGPNSGGSHGACCSGLKGIVNGGIYDSNTGTCALPAGGGLVCSNCGNGTCEQWENTCNCPQDCPMPKTECAQAGEVSRNGSLGPLGPPPKTCCGGLTEIVNGGRFDPNTQTCEMPSGGGIICSACGDGTCDKKWENHCNCPQDCKEPVKK